MPRATDWDEYYRNVPATAHLTRRYTGSKIVSLLRRFSDSPNPVLAEFGGANSCFLDSIVRAVSPRAYHVIDTNQHGLDLLDRRRSNLKSEIYLHNADCRLPQREIQADIAFSVGLIEHFAPVDTRKAILTHFEAVRHGGIVLISFPTPTWLYRSARGVVEALGKWQFPDERPLGPMEVLEVMSECASVMYETTLWPLIFTQH